MLADWHILDALRSRRVVVDPVEPDQVQPASIDLRLDDRFAQLRGGADAIDPACDNVGVFRTFQVQAGSCHVMQPGECLLASTLERVELADDVVGRVEGKSSLGRLFLLVHATAGFIDPGFSGHITLELVNVSPRPWRLWPGMRIAQLSLQQMSAPAAAPYGSAEVGSHYQHQPRGPVLSRVHQRFTAVPPALIAEMREAG
ncbi:dCTP deaminase [Pseudonocardia thermophila]|jgi:deoxycytidine triphosphate deaminase|uniref:dCTP deaminase, dUMP-forming n=1 Tax=Pseudonocardia thermophila TaxID=1848 RepID=A0A1M7AWC8_PSETH|nr:dCTP deaminase [Pseudonocardia thermophila]SHL47043.1 dCTP deaminase [Pseudonocardia thermophila]